MNVNSGFMFMAVHERPLFLLAARAEMRAALADHGFLDRAAAFEAGLAFAAVDAVEHLKISTLPCGVDIIGEGGAAMLDGERQRFADGLVEFRGARGGEARGLR